MLNFRSLSRDSIVYCALLLSAAPFWHFLDSMQLTHLSFNWFVCLYFFPLTFAPTKKKKPIKKTQTNRTIKLQYCKIPKLQQQLQLQQQYKSIYDRSITYANANINSRPMRRALPIHNWSVKWRPFGTWSTHTWRSSQRPRGTWYPRPSWCWSSTMLRTLSMANCWLISMLPVIRWVSSSPLMFAQLLYRFLVLGTNDGRIRRGGHSTRGNAADVSRLQGCFANYW